MEAPVKHPIMSPLLYLAFPELRFLVTRRYSLQQNELTAYQQLPKRRFSLNLGSFTLATASTEMTLEQAADSR